MNRPVYLDNHATTACDPAVVEAMLPYFAESYGNAGSSSHPFGWEAAAAVDVARRRVADLLCAPDHAVVFTSGATESNNLAILGAAARRDAGRIVTTSIEHPAVLDPCRELERRGFELVVLDVDASGRLDPARVADALTQDTVLVSVMAANNEIGTLQPLAEIGALLGEHAAAFHVDGAQLAGRLPVDLAGSRIDYFSLSAHKMHGPKGVGALVVRPRAPRLVPQQLGGGQEGGLRPGTSNVPGIVGLGMAAAVALERLPAEAERIGALRDELQAGLLACCPDATVNGHPQERLPGNLSLTFPGFEAEELLLHLQRRVAVSAGSACSSGSTRPSRVLRAVGLSDSAARSTLRFGIGRFNGEEDVRIAVAAVREALTAVGSSRSAS